MISFFFEKKLFQGCYQYIFQIGFQLKYSICHHFSRSIGLKVLFVVYPYLSRKILPFIIFHTKYSNISLMVLHIFEICFFKRPIFVLLLQFFFGISKYGRDKQQISAFLYLLIVKIGSVALGVIITYLQIQQFFPHFHFFFRFFLLCKIHLFENQMICFFRKISKINTL